VRFLPLQIVMITGAIGLMMGVTGAMVLMLLRGGVDQAPLPPQLAVEMALPVPPRKLTLARTFTPEVQYWGPQILKWAEQYNVDPNILATVIQIESCGDAKAGSGAGAQGLFQVMPQHFSAGEDMLDPETNAMRGISYLIGSLKLAEGHIGLALAGYNGGWTRIYQGWARWAGETKSYYKWGSLIYMDALQNKALEESDGLQSWLEAGGNGLCKQAAARIATTQTPGASVTTATPATVLQSP
jgi:hypothetical protein